MFAADHADKIKQYYTRPDIAAEYGKQQYVTPCEGLLFGTFIKPGMAILDIGVGGGRTSEFLGRKASRYVGLDYAPKMIEICRNKYPQWEYFVNSAIDLSLFQSRSFDAVVMSYNTLDDVIPDANRWRCLAECHRVLRDQGVLIFSSHNPRAIIARPHWQRQRDIAYRPIAGGHTDLYAVGPLKPAHRIRTIFLAIKCSAHRLLRYSWKAPFWRGEGHMFDMGKLMTHFWVPTRVISELTRAGFQFMAMRGDDYPLKSHILTTEWYYYVFSKAG